MSYLMHIGFDNSSRLCRNVYYFEYKGIRYKLIQNNIRKWADALITIVTDDKREKERAYTTASEFLSALSWENNSRVKVWHMGGPSVPDNYQLRKAKNRCFNFHRTPFSGYIMGYDICLIPKIETTEQKNALILFRDALSSNHDYLSFLLFWQILEVGGNKPIGWIDKAYRKHKNKIRLTKDYYEKLPLRGKTLGQYLSDDCRNAIAHIRRKPGKIELKLDTPEDNQRIAIGTHIVKEYARFYIHDKLNLNKNLYLTRKNSKGFPVYVDEKFTKKHYCTSAYKRL